MEVSVAGTSTWRVETSAGTHTGDVVIVETPRRTERLEILGVDNAAPPAATTAA